MDKKQSLLNFKIECNLYYISLTYICNNSLSSRVFPDMLKLSILKPVFHRWEDNIKMAIHEVGCGGVDWIDLA